MSLRTNILMIGTLLSVSACSNPSSQGERPVPILTAESSIAKSRNYGPQVSNQPATKKIVGAGNLQSFELVIPTRDLPTTTSADGAELYNLDLNGIDIRDLAALILGEILDRNYVFDQQVGGTVSIHTSSSVEKEALMPLLRAAVESQNAEMIDDGQLVRFVSREGGNSIGIGGNRQTDIMPIILRQVAATQVREILLPLANDLVDIVVDEKSNTLILAGATRHMAQLRELALTLDVDSLAGNALKLIVLENAEPDQLISELTQVPELNGTTRLVPITRLNALLAVASSADNLQQLQRWIKALDQVGGKNYRNVYSYEARSGQVEELAAIAASVLGLGSSQAPAAPQPLSSEQFPQGTDVDASAQVIGSDSFFGTPATSESEQSSPRPFDNGNAQIVPYASSSQIIAYATKAEWQRISAVLAELDQMPQQVMIEATILEVSLNDSLRYGLQFLFNEGDASFSLPGFASSSISGGSSDGFSFTFDNGSSARTILDALSSVTQVKVISSPRLMVLNNETATLQIGDQVPVSLQSAVPIEANDNRIINSIEFRDTGVIFRVTPKVGSSDTILIDVDQEVSDVAATTTSNIDSPTIRQRRVSSKLLVGDGETIAFAGLTRNSSSDTKNGIPVARDLPLIGPLFGSTEKIQSTSELLVLLTPRIIKNLDDAKALTDVLKSKIKEVDLKTNFTDLN